MNLNRNSYLAQLSAGRIYFEHYTFEEQWYKPIIEPEPAAQARPNPVWRVTLIHHLTGAENGGAHNAYIDLIDQRSQPLTASPARIAWTWQGRRTDEPAPPRIFEKRPPEPLGNLAIYENQIITLWIDDGQHPSERVSNIRTDIDADPATGNSHFHHSWYIVYRLDGSGASPTDDTGADPAPQLTLASLDARLKVVESLLSHWQGGK